MWLFFFAANFLIEAPEPTPGISASLISKLSQRLQLTYSRQCSTEPSVFDVRSTLRYSLTEEVSLLQVPCDFGAYNRVYVFYKINEKGELSQVTFARPETKTDYSKPFDSAERQTFIGISTRAMLVNARFDPSTKELTEFSLGRGLGDMFHASRWIYAEGDFQLLESWDDDTSDGQQNPMLLYHHPSLDQPTWTPTGSP